MPNRLCHSVSMPPPTSSRPIPMPGSRRALRRLAQEAAVGHDVGQPGAQQPEQGDAAGRDAGVDHRVPRRPERLEVGDGGVGEGVELQPGHQPQARPQQRPALAGAERCRGGRRGAGRCGVGAGLDLGVPGVWAGKWTSRWLPLVVSGARWVITRNVWREPCTRVPRKNHPPPTRGPSFAPGPPARPDGVRRPAPWPYSFTAPAVRPSTIHRLARANSSMVGRIVSTAAADIGPQSMLKSR